MVVCPPVFAAGNGCLHKDSSDQLPQTGDCKWTIGDQRFAEMEKPSGLLPGLTSDSGAVAQCRSLRRAGGGSWCSGAVLSPAKKFCEVLAEGPEPPDCVITTK